MPVFHDIALTADGDLPIQSRLVSGRDLVSQRVAFALRLHRGEYLIDTRDGLPWLDWFQQRPPPFGVIDATIKATILAVPGVLEITEYTRVQGDASDAYSITVRITTSDGEEFTTEVRANDRGVPYFIGDRRVSPIA